MKYLKQVIVVAIVLFVALETTAQEQPKKPKVVKTAEKVNQKTQKASEASNEVENQSQQTAANVQNVVNNAKAVIKIFEPILRFRLKKQTITAPTDVAVNNTPFPPNPPAEQQPAAPLPDYNNPAVFVTQNDITQGVPIVAESPAYNTDGTANLGSQNNKKIGCYIDVMRAMIMDEIDAAGQSKSVDLIFTATNAFNEQVPMYAFLTPSYVKNDGAAYNFFKGTKYKDRNIPPASWDEVNESEVAMTALSGEQFEKIQNNNQLMAVVKQIKGFGQKVESRTKLEGKVIAIKTEMGDRTAYGLIYIVNHFGTTGDNGYLKVKIKVTGVGNTGDGTADGKFYQQ
ncbi:MAG: hypothetical protein K2X48_02685 [Chitinophagaceae bacterium]|nr:hypothetical protein [Chitinophagaceae bacterium]